MTAIVTILHAEKEKSIQMNLDPEERVEEIIQKCEDFWCVGGGENFGSGFQKEDQDVYQEHVLLRGNVVLDPEETVISTNIQDGDVLKFVEKSVVSSTERKSRGERHLGKDESVRRGKRWLSENIGVEENEVELVSEEEENGCLTLVFKESRDDGYFTVRLEDGVVSEYLPVRAERGR